VKASRTGLSGAFFLIVQPLIINLIGIPAFACIMRSLGPLKFGQWSIAVSLVALTTFLTNLGLRTIFVRSIAIEPDKAGLRFAEQLGLRFLLALAASGAAILLAWGLAYSRDIILSVAITSLGLVLTVISLVSGDVLQGFQRFKIFATVNFIAGIVLTLLSVGAVLAGCGPVGLSISYLSGPAISATLFLLIIHVQHFPIRIRFDFRRFRDMLNENRTQGVQQFFWVLQDRIEQLLIPKMVGIAEFGYFSAGSMPAGRLTILPDGLSTAFYPALSRQCSQKDRSTTIALTARLIMVSFALCLPFAVLLTFLAGPLSAILFRTRPDICKQVIQVTIWSLPILGLFSPMSFIMQAAGKHEIAARWGIYATVCNVAASIFLIKFFGLNGACWSWVLRSAVSTAFLAIPFLQNFPETVQSLPFVRILTCTGLMSCSLWLFLSFQASPLWSVVLGGGFAMTIYLMALVKFKVMQPTDLFPWLKKKNVSIIGTTDA
jgi:O-antigen/teichoic acid export membrane protein